MGERIIQCMGYNANKKLYHRAKSPWLKDAVNEPCSSCLILLLLVPKRIVDTCSFLGCDKTKRDRQVPTDVVAAAEKVGNTANRKAHTSPDRETILVFIYVMAQHPHLSLAQKRDVGIGNRHRHRASHRHDMTVTSDTRAL